MNYLRHPLSAVWPSLTANEYRELKDDIARNGVIDPITIFEQQVLDGWNRYSICGELDVTCPEVQFAGDYEQARALARGRAEGRNLTEAQKALGIARIMDWKAPGRPKKNPANLAGFPEEAEKSTSQLAESAGVSERTMARAKAVVAHGSPELIEAATEGEVSLSRAADVAIHVPKRDQPIALIDAESSEAAPIAKPKPKPAKKVDPSTADAIIADLRAKIEKQSDEVATYLERLSESADLLEEMRGELESANKVIDADEGAERIKASLAEAKRFRDAYRQQEDRVRGLQGEKNEAIRTAKMWERRCNGNGGKARH